jgi:hypothetical protein
VCAGVAIRAGDGRLDIAICGAKVRDTAGQPWRRLAVALDHEAARHLWMLADAGPKGICRVRAPCSADALSNGIAALAGDRWGRRISAADVRNQRAADAKIAFDGDVERCALWLGHTSAATARYYGRMPAGSAVRGPLPLAATGPRPVRVRARASAPVPDAETAV